MAMDENTTAYIVVGTTSFGEIRVSIIHLGNERLLIEMREDITDLSQSEKRPILKPYMKKAGQTAATACP